MFAFPQLPQRITTSPLDGRPGGQFGKCSWTAIKSVLLCFIVFYRGTQGGGHCWISPPEQLVPTQAAVVTQAVVFACRVAVRPERAPLPTSETLKKVKLI